jgi:hypothetical protein
MNALAIQQLYQQGVQRAQAGWMCESMGNVLGAGQNYQAALHALDACGRLPGAQPLDRLYWMGCCQLRLGWLTYLGGNPAWAQGWFNLAQASLAQVCQLDPTNTAYQGLFQQVQQGQGSHDANSGGSSPWLGLLKKGLGMLPELLELFNKSGNPHGGPAHGASSWLGGLLGGNNMMGNGMDAGWGNWNAGGGWGGYGY